MGDNLGRGVGELGDGKLCGCGLFVVHMHPLFLLGCINSIYVVIEST